MYPAIGGEIGIKLASAFLGAVMALAFQPPKTLVEFWTRFGFAIIAGIMFSEQVRTYFKWERSFENVVASTGLTALVSWHIYALMVRLLTTWKPKG